MPSEAKSSVGWSYTAAVVIIAALFAVAFSVTFVRGEDHVYVWDFRYYWQAYYDYGDSIRSDFWQTLKQIIVQIRSSDYNPAPILLLLPFEFAFGHAREGYIAAVVLLYMVPATFAASLLAVVATGSDCEKRYQQLALFEVLAILFAPFWTPTLRGYPDIVGIVPIAIAGCLVLRTEFGKSINLKRAALIGFLLWLPFLFRKWYAYTIIAFFISAAVYGLYISWAKDRGDWRNIVVKTGIFYTVAGVVLVLLVLLIQYQLAIHAITTNYSDIFAAWQVSAKDHVIEFLTYFGLVTIIGAAIGLIAPAVTGRGFAATLFAALNLVLTVLIFTHVQAFTMQHYFPVALWLFVLICTGVDQFIFMLSGVKRTAAIACIIGSAGILFYGAYWMPSGWRSQTAGMLLPARLTQTKLENYANYQALLTDLSGDMAPDDTFSVYGSSLAFSDSLIHALSNSELDRRLVYASQVDLRDHFDVRSLLTRFVLVADPVQVHLSEATQHVIAEPATRILTGVGIGQAYDRLPNEYELAGGIRAYIFEKKRLFTTEEVNDLFDAFLASYPEWQRESHLKRLLLTADIALGDRVGIVYPETVAHPEAIDELVVRPGETTDTRLSVPKWEMFVQSYSALEMSIPERFSKCLGAKELDVEIKLASRQIWRGGIVPGQIKRITFPSDPVGLFELDVHPNGLAACDELHVNFLTRNMVSSALPR